MLLLFLLASVAVTGARKLTPCEFASELSKPEHNVSFWQIPSWVCLAQQATGLNTNGDHSGQYLGIFRISRFWCDKCGLNCSKLQDEDITDDIDCAVNVVYKTHHNDTHDGFHGWGDMYSPYCLKPWLYLKDFNCHLEPDLGTHPSLEESAEEAFLNDRTDLIALLVFFSVYVSVILYVTIHLCRKSNYSRFV